MIKTEKCSVYAHMFQDYKALAFMISHSKSQSIVISQ